MESNKDEALKCLAIAQKHRTAGNFPSAKRFCQKSLALFSTAEAVKLLQVIEVEVQESEGSSSSAQPAGSSSAAEAHPSAAGARQRHGAESSKAEGKAKANGDAGAGGAQKKRDYTPENVAVVERVRKCKVTEYYEILALKRDCEEAEVKKAYRKVCASALVLSLVLHL